MHVFHVFVGAMVGLRASDVWHGDVVSVFVGAMVGLRASDVWHGDVWHGDVVSDAVAMVVGIPFRSLFAIMLRVFFPCFLWCS